MTRLHKRQEKAARKTRIKEQKNNRPPEGQDADIASIRPGPQPAPAWAAQPQRDGPVKR